MVTKFKKNLFLAFIVTALTAGGPATISNAGEPAVNLNEPSTEPVIRSIDQGLTRAEEAARESAVKVSSPDFRGYGSGTYFEYEGRHFILTAAHVVDDNPIALIMGRSEMVPGRVIYANDNTDIAFLEIDRRLNSREGVALRNNHRVDIGDSVTYTGFPNGRDLLTISGRVSGYRGHWLMVQGYAWMGASGSGVFDQSGRVVGVVSMVEVGYYRSPQIIEDIVHVAKLNEEDMRKFREAL